MAVKHTPFGNFSSVTKRPDGLAVYGWAIDPDTAGSLTVRLLIDGKQVAIVSASRASASLGAAYPSAGPNHVFSSLLHPTRGTHTLCATADNAKGTPGTNAGLGCRTLTF